MNQTTELYLLMNLRSAESIKAHTENPAAFGRIQSRIEEFAEWRDIRALGPEVVLLDTALGEAAMGLYLLASGIHRQAFGSLRLFLELGLASVYFSAHRLELAEWLDSAHDIRWATLSSQEDGVLSRRFCNAFLPTSGPEAIAQLDRLSASYRELSEYVHGNYWTVDEITKSLQFNEGVAKSWLSHFEIIADALLCALCCRFLKELNKDESQNLTAHLREHLTNCPVIRKIIDEREV